MNDRRDDWRTGVDESLIMLKTAQRVTDQQVDDLEVKYEAIDKILRGDPEIDTDGFAARLHNVENGLQEIRATLLKMHMADVEVSKSKWEFAGKIIERLLILAGILLLGWDKLEGLYQKILHQKQSPLEQRIEQAKHPIGKKIFKVHLVQEKAPLEVTKEKQEK